ncbi:MAG TPA: phenylalanine--tRNA ligase beta subunit-related protein [Anaerolineae bacterium]|nr:phenylalanine--tRNA ligase beta subunit-related protein [Anaerolineae bacterium]HQI84093.1 phenylalanine--tRNA ligase beta subunit-related protein [Anaerolineae bacterium]
MLTLTEAWQTAYPTASIGILAMRGVANPAPCPALQVRKAALEVELRERFAGKTRTDIKALPEFEAYTAYYKRFKKTYHVQLQLESVTFKDKPIPSVSALVETMFMGELKNFLLTAIHDLDMIQPPVRIDVADGSEVYVTMSGQSQALKPGDMFIADAVGVLSSIIYGPDVRTQVTPDTRNVLFTVYAPEGITPEAVQRHLEDTRDFVWLIAPDAEVAALTVYCAANAC